MKSFMVKRQRKKINKFSGKFDSLIELVSNALTVARALPVNQQCVFPCWSFLWSILFQKFWLHTEA